VGKLRRTSRLIRVSWEHQAHISADLGSGVNPLRGFLDAEESTGIGARDDQEIPVDPVSLAAGILDLLDVFLDRNDRIVRASSRAAGPSRAIVQLTIVMH
jgi:hypothetical protein